MAEANLSSREVGISRSSANMRYGPDRASSVVHALKPQERVVILRELDDMLEVESTRWQPPVRGYVPRAAILRAVRKPRVFPIVRMSRGADIPSVPISLPLTTFLEWIDTPGESPWLPARFAEAIQDGRLNSVGAQIRASISRRRATWDAWIAEVRAEGREDTCTLDEWITRNQGGRDMWSIRAERIFTDPSERSATLGWVVPEDVLRWTGRVRLNQKEPKYKNWYEVELAKADKLLTGWYKADLLHEFIVPTPETDLAVPGNRETVFELSNTKLRLPADREIDESRRAGRAGAQYIDIKRALGWGVLHHNLCGEFCVAALASVDIIPALENWLEAYPRAKEILSKDWGTSIPDLQSMLDLLGLKYEFFRTVAGVSPVTPSYVRGKLDSGMMAIVGTGVTRFGALHPRSGIRHWAVVEDILRVGDSGWLRMYNPFSNSEEVYRFDEVYDVPSRDSIGLWVEPGTGSLGGSAAAEAIAVPALQTLQAEPAIAN